MTIRRVACGLVLLASLAVPVTAGAQGDLRTALAWLRSQQNPDGGFSNGFSEGSDIGATADAVLAAASAGQSPSTWMQDGVSPLDFLAAQVGQVRDAGLAAKVTLAAVAAGQDPHALGGANLVELMLAGFDAQTGFFGGGPYDSALAILALRAAGEPLPATAVDGLVAARLPDGSYSFNGDLTPGAGDSNTTSLAIQALLIAGAGGEAAPSLDYLRRAQNADGGWTYQKPSAFGEDTDANSTALGIEALLAAGQDLAAWGHPERALGSLQMASGAWMFNPATPSENLLATVQAIPAVAGVDLTDVALLPGRSGAEAGPGLRSGMVVPTLALIVVLLLATAIVTRPSRPTA
ncbi:MAG TPA: prenyltransferase/squalene oxidase repeat-containing protein [Anaerolineales bacterium]|nr:prenyltransferase/squalene oxidase repeat-containing protein [Anaerolineales bacterium]